MAGGRGERLAAGVPKALVRLGGRTLLERAIETLSSVCPDVRIAAPSAMPLPVEPDRRIDDAAPGGGPLAGLVAALDGAGDDPVVVLGVDLPFVGEDTLRALLDALGEAPALVPSPGRIPQPLAALYTRACAATLTRAYAAGERSVTRAVLALAPRLLDGAALARVPGGEGAFFNVNTPQDLAAAEARLGRAPGAAPR